MPHALVTGGAGFIGSHLVEALLADGWTVTVFDNLVTGRRENLAHLAADPGLAFERIDVVASCPPPKNLDAVYHLASPASPVDFERLPLEILRVGAEGTWNALEAARARGAAFLLASTSEVYGNPEVFPQPETYWGRVNPVGPRSPYDEAKRYAEALATAYGRRHGTRVRIARIFNTYGPRMRPDDGRALPAFISAALAGRPLSIHGDGTQTRSFAYVTDTVAGLRLVLEQGQADPINVGSEGERTIREVAECVVSLTGSASSILHAPPAPEDPQRREPNLARLRALGWKPRVSFDEGLRRTIDSFVANAARG